MKYRILIDMGDYSMSLRQDDDQNEFRTADDAMSYANECVERWRKEGVDGTVTMTIEELSVQTITSKKVEL